VDEEPRTKFTEDTEGQELDGIRELTTQPSPCVAMAGTADCILRSGLSSVGATAPEDRPYPQVRRPYGSEDGSEDGSRGRNRRGMERERKGWEI
jgi:hypothetical protein